MYCKSYATQKSCNTKAIQHKSYVTQKLCNTKVEQLFYGPRVHDGCQSLEGRMSAKTSKDLWMPKLRSTYGCQSLEGPMGQSSEGPTCGNCSPLRQFFTVEAIVDLCGNFSPLRQLSTSAAIFHPCCKHIYWIFRLLPPTKMMPNIRIFPSGIMG